MEDRCTECGFDDTSSPPAAVAAALAPLADAVVEAVYAAPPDLVRHRSAPAVWSVTEYLGHLRESMAFHRWLIERACAERDPTFPDVDPDESVRTAGYIEQNMDELADQFRRRIDRLCDVLTNIDTADAERTLTLAGRPLDVALVARSAWHECSHHLGDIRRLAATDT